MGINGAYTAQGTAARGHILLIGGAPGAGRGRQPRPEATLALLATVATGALLGSGLPADTVQLADPPNRRHCSAICAPRPPPPDRC
ncbi:hypothetical protein GXW82_05110 [Streptacidiphilus sp. 4-A2]|nr:hypothetical protein [Streptacidiphilus sp. 4-A2]